MSTPPQLPVLGPGPGTDTCAVCRSPLGPEQRYCLHCGARREGARLEFLDVLAEPQGVHPAPQAIADATPHGGGRRGWLRDGSVLGAAVVLVGTLVAGLLIGHWAGGSSTSGGPTTQVIRLVGASGVSAGGTAADPGVAAADAGAAVKKTKKKAKAKAAATRFSPSAAPVKVTPQSEQQALNDTSGTEDLAPKDTNPNGANFDEIK